jgi:hypothetical protein
MAIKGLWVIFTCLVFLSASVCLVWGQDCSLGINTGDTFVYSYNKEWQSNQIGVEPPSSIIDPGDLQYVATAIMSVDGASVTSNTSYCYNTGIWMEVATTEYGGGYVPFFVPSNLSAGDYIPGIISESGPVAATYINETTNQSRTTNHLQLVLPVGGFANVSCNAYWDQATGVLTQAAYSFSNQTGDTATNWSVNVTLTETSLFTISNSQSPLPSPSIPELSYWAGLFIVTLVTIGLFVFSKRKMSSFKVDQNHAPMALKGIGIPNYT